LKKNARNARTHDKKQITQIAASIRKFGFTNPVLIDDQGLVLAGHGRLAAAEQLGWQEVPTLTLAGLTAAQKRAYVLADNRLAEKAGWDLQILGEELKFLSEIEIDFDVSITGFDTVEIDRLVDGLQGTVDPRADEAPPCQPDQPVISRLGDVWLLGRHRLLCGDALDPASYERLLEGKAAQLVFTDPPYNVPIDGHVGGNGRIRHREFVMASGEMSEGEFAGFLTRALHAASQASADGAILFVCMDWRHASELLAAARQVRLEYKNLCVWAKDNGGMGTFYRSQHELVFVFKRGHKAHINNFGLGETGRYRTNVWNYAGVNTLRPGRRDELAMHPTVKPVALVADAIRDCSHRGGIVLDPFAGSGTTLIAAEKTGRVGCALELDPRYVDVVVRRWEAFTGGMARHATTGRTFAETTEERLPQPPAGESGDFSSKPEASHERR
jgi:DNA modification methylase